MYILGIDSTTDRLFAAVSLNGKTMSNAEIRDSHKHMVSAIRVIDSVLKKAGIKLEDIDVFSVNIGPGDFTGTRIGSSIIKTLSWVKGKKAYGVSALDVYAVGILRKNILNIDRKLKKGQNIVISPLLDVRRGEIYFSFYKLLKNSIAKKASGAEDYKKGTKICCNIEIGGIDYSLIKIEKNILEKADNINKHFLNLGSNHFYYLSGSAALNYKKMLSGIAMENKNIFLDKNIIYPDAECLNIISYLKALRGEEDKNLVPAYIREFMPFGGKDGR